MHSTYLLYFQLPNECLFHIIPQIKILILFLISIGRMSRYACNSIVYHILTCARSRSYIRGDFGLHRFWSAYLLLVYNVYNTHVM